MGREEEGREGGKGAGKERFSYLLYLEVSTNIERYRESKNINKACYLSIPEAVAQS